MFLCLDPDYRVGVFGGAIWYLAASIYFAVHGRKTLVYSPEEEFAVRAHAGEEAVPRNRRREKADADANSGVHQVREADGPRWPQTRPAPRRPGSAEATLASPRREGFAKANRSRSRHASLAQRVGAAKARPQACQGPLFDADR